MQEIMDAIESALFMEGHEVVESQEEQNGASMVLIMANGKKVKLSLNRTRSVRRLRPWQK